MPDYEITIAGRTGPVVASCLPGLRSVATPVTVLHLNVPNQRAVTQLLGVLADHHLTLVDVRIGPALPRPLANLPSQPSAATQRGRNPLQA